MKKWVILATGAALVMAAVPVLAKSDEAQGPKNVCTTIQSGELSASTGEQLTTGFDQYGYNYQAHQYIGYYGNYQRPPEPVDWGYRLMMKWNDAWLSNKDCDGDGKLDRHYGFGSYIGSGAWLTNHMSGTDDIDGETCKWTYFVKIVAAPEGAYPESGRWYTSDGVEIGEVIWGSFAIIQSVYNSPCEGAHGVEYLSPASPGFGYYKP